MAASREALIAYFQDGNKPTEIQFRELIEAFVHVDDDLDLAIGAFAEVGEAEAGLVTDKYMNPFLVKKAILALVRLANIPELLAEVDEKTANMAHKYHLSGWPIVFPPGLEYGDTILWEDTIVYIYTESGFIEIEP